MAIDRLPCRITVYTQGVEAFLHNRTPAYEAIIERMKKHEEDEKASHKFESTSSDTTAHDLGKHARLRKSANITTAPSSRNSSEDNPLKTAESESQLVHHSLCSFSREPAISTQIRHCERYNTGQLVSRSFAN